MSELAELAELCKRVHAGERIEESFHTDSLRWSLTEDKLIFSGSKTLRDWLHNAQLWPRQSGSGLVHSGFLGLAIGTWSQIKSTVLSGDKIRTVTGYSLGAAVALLVAERLRNVKVVTFASPAVGNNSWVQHYPHLVTRCWVNPDLVTCSILGRRHIGSSVMLPGGYNPILNHLYTLERWWG